MQENRTRFSVGLKVRKRPVGKHHKFFPGVDVLQAMAAWVAGSVRSLRFWKAFVSVRSAAPEMVGMIRWHGKEGDGHGRTIRLKLYIHTVN